jgi:hypothetical protein
MALSDLRRLVASRMRLPGLWPGGAPWLRDTLLLVTLPDASERVSASSPDEDAADSRDAAERSSSAAACGGCCWAAAAPGGTCQRGCERGAGSAAGAAGGARKAVGSAGVNISSQPASQPTSQPTHTCWPPKGCPSGEESAMAPTAGKPKVAALEPGTDEAAPPGCQADVTPGVSAHAAAGMLPGAPSCGALWAPPGGVNGGGEGGSVDAVWRAATPAAVLLVGRSANGCECGE